MCNHEWEFIKHVKVYKRLTAEQSKSRSLPAIDYIYGLFYCKKCLLHAKVRDGKIIE
jgi:hypothetical protein